jgi:hypothetical protein
MGKEPSVSMIARNTALVRSARVAVAVERFRRDHAGAFPAGAADLVPQYLPSLPIDPFSGQPRRLVPKGSGYKVYSVGTNRVDDGGRFDGTELLGRDAAKRLDSAEDFGIRIAHR